MSDRAAGLLLLALAVWYGIAGHGFQSDFVTDPLGPAAWPVALAAMLALFSLYLIVRPDAEPHWPSATVWGRQAAVVASLVIYAALLEIIGFIVDSTLLVGLLALLLGATRRHALVMGVASSLVLYALFNYALGLPLPAGALFGG